MNSRNAGRLLEQENEVLRRAAAYLSQSNLPGKGYTREFRELATEGIPIAVSLRVLKLSRAPYYRWLKEPITQAEVTWAYRANALFDAHVDDPEFGHRFLADEAREAGEMMSNRTAWNITSTMGWWSTFGKKKTRKGTKPAGPAVHDDLCAFIDAHGVLRHRFDAERPNELWLTDTRRAFHAGREAVCVRGQGRPLTTASWGNRWLHG